MILPKNLERVEIIGCRHCGVATYTDDDQRKCRSASGNYHWPQRTMESYNYFKVDKEWYIVKGRNVEAFLSLIEVEEAVSIQGAMQHPKPTRLDTQTELIAMLQKKGVTDEELSKHFRMSHMRGRVFKQLIKG